MHYPASLKVTKCGVEYLRLSLSLLRNISNGICLLKSRNLNVAHLIFEWERNTNNLLQLFERLFLGI